MQQLPVGAQYRPPQQISRQPVSAPQAMSRGQFSLPNIRAAQERMQGGMQGVVMPPPTGGLQYSIPAQVPQQAPAAPAATPMQVPVAQAPAGPTYGAARQAQMARASALRGK